MPSVPFIFFVPAAFFPGFPCTTPAIFSATPCTLSNNETSLLFVVLGAFFVAGAAAVVFFALGAAVDLLTRPVAVLFFVAVAFLARGLEVLAFGAAVGFLAVALLFFFVAGLVLAEGMVNRERGTVIPEEPLVMAMAMKGLTVLEWIREIFYTYVERTYERLEARIIFR